MSKRTQSSVAWILTAVLLLSCTMLYLESRKTIENLPSQALLLQMGDRKASRKVKGYMEHVLQEVWGNPDRSDAETMVWETEDGAITVRADGQGKITGCCVRRIGDLPVLHDMAYMTHEEMETWLLGRLGDQLSPIWNSPDAEKTMQLIWDLPPHSPHRAITVDIDHLGIVSNADFTD